MFYDCSNYSGTNETQKESEQIDAVLKDKQRVMINI